MNLSAIPEMLDWTRKAGYDVSDFAKRGLRCIHVAGTKGKGSVCAMIENILMQYRRNDKGTSGTIMVDKCLGKIGLYTSPHLMTVRERIRIDGAPISESLFSRYFFELWDRFPSTTNSNLSDPNTACVDVRPGYFRYLTLLALHAFMEEGVETAIVECGIGGEYDSTNILPPEAVTVSGITRLGIDHVGMLGDTIESIATHKGGIMKRNVPAYTVEQIPEAQAALENCADRKGAELGVVARLTVLENDRIKLSLGGDFQKDNASLAIVVAASHLRTLGITDGITSFDDLLMSSKYLPPKFVRGLETTKWPGRCEVRKDGNIEWLIDGAHTVDSLEAIAYWYISKLEDALLTEIPPTTTMLIFNQQDRDAKSLIRSFLTVLEGKPPINMHNAQSPVKTRHYTRKRFTYAVFCTNIPFKSDVPAGLDLSSQEETARTYQNITSNSLNICYSSVEEAVELVRKVSNSDERVLVLATGSLHLVGALLKVLDRDSRRIVARKDTSEEP
jgi:folylpolyglutamate synthase